MVCNTRGMKDSFFSFEVGGRKQHHLFSSSYELGCRFHLKQRASGEIWGGSCPHTHLDFFFGRQVEEVRQGGGGGLSGGSIVAIFFSVLVAVLLGAFVYWKFAHNKEEHQPFVRML